MSPAATVTARRSVAELRQQYEIERGLAHRLRTATHKERKHLYAVVYDELFRQVPAHPQLTRKVDEAAVAEAVKTRLALLRPHLRENAVFMEVGPGDCSLAVAVAARVRRVYAVDVSAEITSRASFPANFDLILCDGASIPIAPRSVDVAFSYQLVEHLHPEDAEEHVANVRRVLAPGGVYVCVTPNALSGPHDISKHFSAVADGFHLKEYTARDMAALLKRRGFSRVDFVVGCRGAFVRIPTPLLTALEVVLRQLPSRIRRRVAAAAPFRQLLGLLVVGRV